VHGSLISATAERQVGALAKPQGLSTGGPTVPAGLLHLTTLGSDSSTRAQSVDAAGQGGELDLGMLLDGLHSEGLRDGKDTDSKATLGPLNTNEADNASLGRRMSARDLGRHRLHSPFQVLDASGMESFLVSRSAWRSYDAAEEKRARRWEKTMSLLVPSEERLCGALPIE